MSTINGSATERKPFDYLCAGYCKCAWACYLVCLFAPVLTLLVVLFWGLGVLIF